MNKYLLIGLVLLCTSAGAAINKWVDKDGRVHYSDQSPPTDVQQQTLRANSEPEASPSASSVAAPSAPKSIAEREVELKKAQKAKQEAADLEAQKKKVAEAKQANCETSKQNLRGLQDGVRIMEVDSDGVRAIMSDEKRQQRLVKSHQDVDTYCK